LRSLKPWIEGAKAHVKEMTKVEQDRFQETFGNPYGGLVKNESRLDLILRKGNACISNAEKSMQQLPLDKYVYFAYILLNQKEGYIYILEGKQVKIPLAFELLNTLKPVESQVKPSIMLPKNERNKRVDMDVL
jgi:hypothetical protein